jgi:cell division septum initiation protein DivIVA
MTVLSRMDQRLTPDVVQSITFPVSRLGRRGCDEDHVRVFVKQVEIELTRLLNERTALQEEVRRLRARVLGRSTDGPGYRREDAQIQAVGILSKAQLTADRYVLDAQEYSRKLAEDARKRRDEILREAHTSASRVLEEAQERGSLAAQAAMLESNGSSVAERRELEAELAYLRTFSDVYRTHLKAYLDALLRNVEDWEQSERSALREAPAPAYPAAVSRVAAAPVPGESTWPPAPASRG